MNEPHILFISDLHLDPRRKNVTKLFLEFIESRAVQAEALYILGDFFEYWTGDDDSSDFIETIKNVLKGFTDKKIPVFFMHGNRDFLIGKRFAMETGCKLIDDPTIIDAYGTPILLMHGDSLCTDDIRHIKFRKLVRNPLFQKYFLKLPLSFRKKIATRTRKISSNHVTTLPDNIMDVTPTAVTQAMQQHQVSLMIHGHTHRPNIHPLLLKNAVAKRIVLGSWHDAASICIYHSDGKYQLETI